MIDLLEIFDRTHSSAMLCGATKRKKIKHNVINVFKGTKWASICLESSCPRFCNDTDLIDLSKRMSK